MTLCYKQELAYYSAFRPNLVFRLSRYGVIPPMAGDFPRSCPNRISPLLASLLIVSCDTIRANPNLPDKEFRSFVTSISMIWFLNQILYVAIEFGLYLPQKGPAYSL